jgi:hypothetical protein
MIFGENLLALMVLALGAALAVGNAMALVRPRRPEDVGTDELVRPPLGRSIIMIVLGVLAAVWALASLATADDTANPTADPAASASSAVCLVTGSDHPCP